MLLQVAMHLALDFSPRNCIHFLLFQTNFDVIQIVAVSFEVEADEMEISNIVQFGLSPSPKFFSQGT